MTTCSKSTSQQSTLKLLRQQRAPAKSRKMPSPPTQLSRANKLVSVIRQLMDAGMLLKIDWGGGGGMIGGIHLFSGRAVKQERIKGSSRRQHTARRQRRRYLRSRRRAAAQRMLAGERENGARRYIQHDRSCAPHGDPGLRFRRSFTAAVSRGPVYPRK